MEKDKKKNWIDLVPIWTKIDSQMNERGLKVTGLVLICGCYKQIQMAPLVLSEHYKVVGLAIFTKFLKHH